MDILKIKSLLSITAFFFFFLIPQTISASPTLLSDSDSIDLSELTWPEIVKSINKGKNTIIVPSGGIEQNGFHMILGKHDYIVRKTSHEIATRLGNALVSPIISFVPEGGFDPKSGNMIFPGTIGISDYAYMAMLDGIIRSLRLAGFKNICLIADHGGSLEIHRIIAEKFNKEWSKDGIKVINVSSYYNSGIEQKKYLKKMGYTDADIGDHAGMLDTSELMSIHPSGVGFEKLRQSTLKQDLRGDSGDPTKSSYEIGKKLVEIKIQAAVSQIQFESLKY